MGQSQFISRLFSFFPSLSLPLSLCLSPLSLLSPLSRSLFLSFSLSPPLSPSPTQEFRRAERSEGRVGMRTKRQRQVSTDRNGKAASCSLSLYTTFLSWPYSVVGQLAHLDLDPAMTSALVCKCPPDKGRRCLLDGRQNRY